MKSRNLIRLTITLLFGSVLILGGYEAQARTLADGNHGGGGGPATLLVDNDKVQCPPSQFTSIQAAVHAARSGASQDCKAFDGSGNRRRKSEFDTYRARARLGQLGKFN